MASDIQQAPFVKELAANDRPTRDKALLSLRTFLSGRRSLPPLELLKLHKGLFYCMWMCDRPLPQQSLASSLANLVSILPPQNILPFQRAFWQTMSREWTNIDVLRMEKFLLLTRRYVGACLGVMRDAGWEGKVVEEQLALLVEVPFNVHEVRLPNGLRFHVIDIWVDELERVGVLGEGEEEEEERKKRIEVLMGPLRVLAKESPTKAVRIKAKEALADERLPGNDKPEKEVEEDGWGGIQD